METTNNSIEGAESIRNDLRLKLEDAKRQLEGLDARRQELAFQAHAHGGEAKKELDRLNKTKAAHIAEIETIEAAVLEASRRLEDAKRGDALEADSKRAERALEIADGLVERARKIDSALAAVVEESLAFQADLRTLNHQLKVTHPNESQLQSLGERAVKSAFMFSAFKLEHLAPRERYTFARLAEGWAQQIKRSAEPRLIKQDEAA